MVRGAEPKGLKNKIIQDKIHKQDRVQSKLASHNLGNFRCIFDKDLHDFMPDFRPRFLAFFGCN